MTGSMVEVEFNIGSKKIKVVRGIKPNVFEIYVNGKMYNQDANVRDYQKYLEQQILKLNYRSFTQVVILGSSTFIPFMQLKSRHRREVVEEILDIQIFSTMNMILKQRLKTNSDEIKDTEYQISLHSEKIELQKKYLAEVIQNKEKLIEEKTTLISKNEEEIHKRKEKVDGLSGTNIALLKQISDSDSVKSKFQKLQDIHSTLNEKHKTHSKTINFFETNEDCPTCQQHISKMFKTDMIKQKQTEANKVSDGISQLKNELKKYKERQKEIVKIAS